MGLKYNWFIQTNLNYDPEDSFFLWNVTNFLIWKLVWKHIVIFSLYTINKATNLLTISSTFLWKICLRGRIFKLKSSIHIKALEKNTFYFEVIKSFFFEIIYKLLFFLRRLLNLYYNMDFNNKNNKISTQF